MAATESATKRVSLAPTAKAATVSAAVPANKLPLASIRLEEISPPEDDGNTCKPILSPYDISTPDI